MKKEEVRLKSVQIKNAAVFNHSAHNLLSEVIEKSLNLNNENILMMITPDVIICAFTCELYFKAILYNEGIDFKQTHKLDELFLLLDTQTQKFIEQETISGLQHYDPKKVYDFKQTLKNNGNAFVQMRYFYEKNLSIDYLFLQVLVKVLEHTCNQVFKQEC